MVDVGEEGISVAPRPGGEEIFSRFFALPRFIEIGQLESHRKWGIRMQPYAQQPRNSPRVHTEDRSLSSPRAYATSEQGRFACEKKNEVSSANCGDTLGSRMEDSRYFRGDTRMAEISLGYEWWACVGLRFVDSMRHRMRRVHLDFLLFQS